MIGEAFHENVEAVAAEAEAAYDELFKRTPTDTGTETAADFPITTGPTEAARTIRARRVQGFFRDAVLTSYGSRCAISGIAVPELLNASHIIPWSKDIARRADPCNGIALNVLYDRAFDRGLITFDEPFRLVLSDRLKSRRKKEEFPILLQQAFLALEGEPLHLPTRFKPDQAALKYHREVVFGEAGNSVRR